MSTASPIGNSACPRCGQPFRCGVADARCDCFDVQLTPGLREQLAEQFSSCLCVNCLKQLRDQAAAAAQAGSRTTQRPLDRLGRALVQADQQAEAAQQAGEDQGQRIQTPKR